MSATDSARDDAYDVVVIGSGFGGLVAAAMLARAGWKVLVVEQADAVGGYAHAFERGPYLFDPAVHVTAQAQDGNLLDTLFRHLDIHDRLEFVRINWLFEPAFPDFVLPVPFGPREFVEAHVQHFPHERDGFETLVKLWLQIHEEAHNLPPTLSLRELDAAVERFPTLFGHQNTTLGEVLDDLLTEPKLKALAAGLWPYLGLPPSRLSFLTFSQMFGVHIDGSFYCVGTFDRVVQALAWAVERDSGEILLGQRVERILVDGGKAVGIELPSGQRVEANVVVSNADAYKTFVEMVGEDNLPTPFVRRLSRLEPSLSAFVVFAATSLDLGHAAHETFLFKTWDHEETFRDVLDGKHGAMWINVPTVADPSLAPPGEHIAIVSCLVPYDIGKPWEKVKDRFAETLVKEFDLIYPGLSDNLNHLESATPKTVERFALNRDGATYGWANTPQQSASRRLSHLGPIENLYLSGHWTQPGSGSLRSMVSGLHTAIIALARAGEPIPQVNPPGETAPRVF
jgi:prolycopene isomerase